jgi:hypothetical protein
LNCKGYDFTIKVLDDGTPQKYLDKLQNKFPDIKIYKSEFYNEKVKYCDLGQKPKVMIVPINFWIECVKKSSDYFVLLEDDIWINQEINFHRMIIDAKNDDVSFIKLFWIGNPKLMQKKAEIVKENYRLFKPKLYTKFPALFYFIFYKFNRFKIRKILKILKIHTFERYLAYYSIYAVAGNVFKKDYYLSVWKNHKNVIDENLQLYNAVKLFYKNKMIYAHSNQEIVTQGILSAATNQFKEYNDINADMFMFNKIMNEAWFNDEFDSMKKYPKDIGMDEIESILIEKNNILLKAEDWKKWVNHFKNSYRNFGCIIE